MKLYCLFLNQFTCTEVQTCRVVHKAEGMQEKSRLAQAEYLQEGENLEVEPHILGLQHYSRQDQY